MTSNRKWKLANLKQLVLLILLLGLAIYGLSVFYAHLAEAAMTQVVFENRNGQRTAVFKLELAARPELRTKGLMYRKKHEFKSDGMLFIFPEVSDHSIWMKNTMVSLDLLYLGEGGEVLGVIPNAPVLDEHSQKVGKPSRYVIELLAGSAARSGIQAGSRVLFLTPIPRPL